MQGEFWENFSRKKCVSWGRKHDNYNSIISMSLGMFSKWITDRYKDYLKSIHPQVSIHSFSFTISFMTFQFPPLASQDIYNPAAMSLVSAAVMSMRTVALDCSSRHQWMWVDGHFECSALVTLINHPWTFQPIHTLYWKHIIPTLSR